jgi:hypothetical protein
VSQDQYAVVAIRLVGGPASGLVFTVAVNAVPRFFGVGYPVSRYEPEPGDGALRIFRHVGVN